MFLIPFMLVYSLSRFQEKILRWWKFSLATQLVRYISSDFLNHSIKIENIHSFSLDIAPIARYTLFIRKISNTKEYERWTTQRALSWGRDVIPHCVCHRSRSRSAWR